jgi:hypothetical protein
MKEAAERMERQKHPVGILEGASQPPPLLSTSRDEKVDGLLRQQLISSEEHAWLKVPTAQAKRLAVVAGCIALALGGVGAAFGVTQTTGTVSVCATASTPTQTISANGTEVGTVAPSVASKCTTVTYTIPTVTNTVTVTSGTPSATPSATPTATPLRRLPR